MRPHKFENTWIDLDHVLAIEPSDQYYSVKFEMAFRDEPLWINYRDDAALPALIEAWKNGKVC